MDLDEVRTDGTRRRTRTYRKGCRRGLRTRPASDMEIADLEAIAAYVYARPPGEVKQEAAGVAVTLFALAEAHGFDLLLETEKEIERITHLPATISQQKQATKAAAGIGRFPEPLRLESAVTQQEDLPGQVEYPP